MHRRGHCLDGLILGLVGMLAVSCAHATSDVSISLARTGGNAYAGTNLTYTVIAQNAGPAVLNSSATVTATFAGQTCTWTCARSGGSTCTASGAGNIQDTFLFPNGSAATFTVQCAIPPSATGTLHNTANVAPVAPETDPNPGNNSATLDLPLATITDLSITKTDGVTTARFGGSVTYTMVASNAGPSNASGAKIVDTFPVGESCTWVCHGAGGNTCTPAGTGNINDTAIIAVGGSVTYTATCSLSLTAPDTLTNTATITEQDGAFDFSAGNNSASDTDTLVIFRDGFE